MATAVISACLPTLRPVFASFCRFVGLSQVVSSMGERSRGISLPDRLDRKTAGTAPPSSKASINREEMVGTHIGHTAKGSDVDSCSFESDGVLCPTCHGKSGANVVGIKTTEIHQEYESRNRTGSDGTSQRQQEVQSFSVV